MDVYARWVAWALVLIPLAGVFTIAALVRDEWRAKRSLENEKSGDLRL